MSKEDRDARKARARELSELQRAGRRARIQKRLDEEAAQEAAERAAVKAHELRTSERDAVARRADRIGPEAADAFQKAVGLTPEQFRQALLYDPSRGRARKSLDAYNAIVRRLEKGEIDKAAAMLKTHRSRLKDTAKDGAKAAADFEKKNPRRSHDSSGTSGNDRDRGGFSWWLRGGR